MLIRSTALSDKKNDIVKDWTQLSKGQSQEQCLILAKADWWQCIEQVACTAWSQCNGDCKEKGDT